MKKQNKNNDFSVYEAGFCGFSVHKELIYGKFKIKRQRYLTGF